MNSLQRSTYGVRQVVVDDVVVTFDVSVPVAVVVVSSKQPHQPLNSREYMLAIIPSSLD